LAKRAEKQLFSDDWRKIFPTIGGKFFRHLANPARIAKQKNLRQARRKSIFSQNK